MSAPRCKELYKNSHAGIVRQGIESGSLELASLRKRRVVFSSHTASCGSNPFSHAFDGLSTGEGFPRTRRPRRSICIPHAALKSIEAIVPVPCTVLVISMFLWKPEEGRVAADLVQAADFDFYCGVHTCNNDPVAVGFVKVGGELLVFCTQGFTVAAPGRIEQDEYIVGPIQDTIKVHAC